MNQICVVGGANVDICGASVQKLVEYDSNPGTIEIRFGGVGRNIAQVMTLLGKHVSFVTCFSDDIYGKEMMDDCRKLGMDISGCMQVHDLPSSCYLAVMDETGDMRVAVNDMRILDRLDVQTINRSVRQLNQHDMLVLDANLSETVIHSALHEAACMRAADPVSMAKAGKFRDCMNELTIFKPNRYEAGYLSGIQVKDDASAKQCALWFLNQGVKEILISLAAEGVIVGTKAGIYHLKHRAIKVNNATGGGDTFMGAYCAERTSGSSALESAQYAAAASAAAIQMDIAERRKLNDEMIRHAIADLKIQIETL